MNVTLQIRVPLTRVEAINATLDRARQAHVNEISRAGNKVKPERLAELNEIGKKLTVNHLLRAVVEYGIEEVSSAKTDDLFKILLADTVVRGRKRGSR